jgi:hypothetical protein
VFVQVALDKYKKTTCPYQRHCTNMVLAAGTGLVNPHFEFLYFEPGALQKTMPTVSSPVGIMFLLFTAGLECRVLLWTTFCFAKTIANRVLTGWREFLPTWFFFIGGEAGLTLTFVFAQWPGLNESVSTRENVVE